MRPSQTTDERRRSGACGVEAELVVREVSLVPERAAVSGARLFLDALHRQADPWPVVVRVSASAGEARLSLSAPAAGSVRTVAMDTLEVLARSTMPYYAMERAVPARDHGVGAWTSTLTFSEAPDALTLPIDAAFRALAATGAALEIAIHPWRRHGQPVASIVVAGDAPTAPAAAVLAAALDANGSVEVEHDLLARTSRGTPPPGPVPLVALTAVLCAPMAIALAGALEA